MKESTMTDKEYNKRMSAYYRLLSNASVLSSERNGVRSATTRSVQMVDDLSRPDELKKGDTPAVIATRQRTRLVLRKANRNGLL